MKKKPNHHDHLAGKAYPLASEETVQRKCSSFDSIRDFLTASEWN